MKVQDVMTWDVEACAPDSNLAEAAMIMWRRDCGIVPVVRNPRGQVVGVITDRDICIATATKHREPAAIQVGDAMTKNPRTCAPTEDVHAALEAMKKAQVRRLPVLDGEGQLKGMLSLNDVSLAADRSERKTDAGLAYREVMDVLRAISAHRARAEVVAAAS